GGEVQCARSRYIVDSGEGGAVGGRPVDAAGDVGRAGEGDGKHDGLVAGGPYLGCVGHGQYWGGIAVGYGSLGGRSAQRDAGRVAYRDGEAAVGAIGAVV